MLRLRATVRHTVQPSVAYLNLIQAEAVVCVLATVAAADQGIAAVQMPRRLQLGLVGLRALR